MCPTCLVLSKMPCLLYFSILSLTHLLSLPETFLTRYNDSDCIRLSLVSVFHHQLLSLFPQIHSLSLFKEFSDFFGLRSSDYEGSRSTFLPENEFRWYYTRKASDKASEG